MKLKAKVSAVIAFLAAVPLSGAEVIFDFETEDERAKVPKLNILECVRGDAVSGKWSLRYKPPTWRIGLGEWPSFNLVPELTDWTGYDRLVIDIVNYSQAAWMSAFIGGEGSRVQNGLSPRSVEIPEQGFVRWTIPLEKWPKTASQSDVRRVHLFMTRPIGVDIRLDRFILLKPGEEPPAITAEFIRGQVKRAFSGRLRDMERDFPDMKTEFDSFRRRLDSVADAESYQRLFRDLAAMTAAQRHADAMRRFRDACVDAGQPRADGFFVGKATSMEKVRPRSTDMPLPADKISVRLARGEYESVQIFVLPEARDLTDVRITVSDLRGRSASRPVFAAANVKSSVLGYVETKRLSPYSVAMPVPCATNETGYTRVSGKGEPGWWPDPILDYLDGTDVRKGDLQGFWLRFRAPRDQLADVYRGEITVSAAGVALRRIPLAVRVYGFEVPAKTPLPMAITFSPGPSSQFATPEEQIVNAKLRKDPEFPGNAWKRHEGRWYDFLADYYITVDNLYHRGNGGYPKTEALGKLASEGRLDCFNLGYWGYPKTLSDADKESWRRHTLGHLKRSWERVKAAGLEKFAYIYGCDEIKPEFFPQIRWAVTELKKEFPGVPLSTTAYDHSFGTGSELSAIDWFTPLTPKYDGRKADAARKDGRRVWWYICCSPHEPYANMFIECPAIEGRVLMGAQTAKYRPDGFLYYQISIWNSPRPISGASAFTDWVARSWTTYHGDGSWVCCGPDGTPLSTVRLENFRDGLEDYAYVRILEDKLAGNPGAAWAEEARKLIAVPSEVARDLENYTYDPEVIYTWRERIAKLIERASASGR